MYTQIQAPEERSFENENLWRNRKWHIFLGFLGLVALVVAAASIAFNPKTQHRLETVNNIVRRYRCPPGGYPAGRKANGDCLCLKCPAGFFCPGGYSGKVPCARGSYQNVLGQNTCKGSPPGYHAPQTGQPLPTRCPPGTFQPNSGKWSCIPTFPGYHAPYPRMRNQIKCPIGKYQNLRGQAACKPAPKGTYVNLVGQSRPTPCNYGTYNKLIGQVRCKPARPGRYVSTRGQIFDLACRTNTYQHCYGQVRCIPCAFGLTAERGALKCVLKQSKPVAVVSVKKQVAPVKAHIDTDGVDLSDIVAPEFSGEEHLE